MGRLAEPGELVFAGQGARGPSPGEKTGRERWGGERARDRTWDLLVKSQLLYRLSYAPHLCAEMY